MKVVKKILFIIVGVLVLVESYQLFTDETTITSAVANAVFNNNFHEVVPGKLYRSAEMSSQDLTKLVQENGIKTVIDLRMQPKTVRGSAEAEDAALEKLNVHYLHFPLLGSEEMSPEQVKELIGDLDSAQTPVPVHCSSGTHRSGVVSAIWLMDNDGAPFKVAADQLSAKYGFFKMERELKSFVGGHPTIDNILWRYQKANDKKQISFREWVAAGMPD